MIKAIEEAEADFEKLAKCPSVFQEDITKGCRKFLDNHNKAVKAALAFTKAMLKNDWRDDVKDAPQFATIRVKQSDGIECLASRNGDYWYGTDEVRIWPPVQWKERDIDIQSLIEEIGG